jgi:hypothetical protein
LHLQVSQFLYRNNLLCSFLKGRAYRPRPFLPCLFLLLSSYYIWIRNLITGFHSIIHLW